MFEADAPSTQRVVAELKIGPVRQRIDEIAARLSGSYADADDLVANALVLVCDPDRSPWDPSQGSLAKHVGFIMRDLWIAQNRRARTRREVVDSEVAHEAPTRNATSVDEALAEHETRVRMKRLGLELRAGLVADDPIALKVFDEISAGSEGLDAIARAIGCAVKDVEKALRRIAYRGARIKEQDDEAFAGPRRLASAGDGQPRSDQDRS